MTALASRINKDMYANRQSLLLFQNKAFFLSLLPPMFGSDATPPISCPQSLRALSVCLLSSPGRQGLIKDGRPGQDLTVNRVASFRHSFAVHLESLRISLLHVTSVVGIDDHGFNIVAYSRRRLVLGTSPLVRQHKQNGVESGRAVSFALAQATSTPT